MFQRLSKCVNHISYFQSYVIVQYILPIKFVVLKLM